MKTQLQLATLALLLASLNFQLALAQGSLTPPGAPAAGMKTLAQIEPRTPISDTPYTISVPGSYYLTTNLYELSGNNAITIATNGVKLDLNGFTIFSTNSAGAGFAIALNSGLKNISIADGFIQGAITNNGSGVFGGSGFSGGLVYIGAQPANVYVANLSVSGCSSYGINLGLGDTTVVEACTVRTVGGDGILVSTVKNSVAKDCGVTAIYCAQANDSRGETVGIGYGLYAATAMNCYGSSSSGNGLTATTAQNCYGSSSSSSGNGLTATTAVNCYGNGGGYGLQVYGSAQNCFGNSTSGTGIYAYAALNCYGNSSSGYGLLAYGSVQNCYGYSSSNYGMVVYGSAQNCYGSSYSGTGLYAYIATACTGNRYGGTAINAIVANGCYAYGGTNIISYKYNMP